MSETSALILSPIPHSDFLNLGPLVASPSDITSILISAINNSSQPQTVYLSFSKNIASILLLHAITPVTTSHPSTNQFDSIKNINLLHIQTFSSHKVTIPPNSSIPLNLSISATARPDHPADLSGNLDLFTDPSKSPSFSLPLRGRIYYSVLRPDRDFLDFGRCSVGTWYYNELVVQNTADVSTNFTISTDFPVINDPEQTSICFRDHNFDHVLDLSKIPIPPLGTVRVKVGVRPLTIGDEERYFSLQNLRNPLDTSYVHLIAKGTAEHVAESLHVSCGSEIDFGDCYAHYQTSQDISLHNDYNETITVTLSSDRRQQIYYQVLQEHAHSDILAPHSLHDFYLASSPLDALVAENPTQLTNSSTIIADDHKCPELGSTTRNQLTERVTLWAGQRKKLKVWYVPAFKTSREGVSDSRHSMREDLTRLRAQRFHLVFRLPMEESRTITARAKVCESTIRLERDQVYLGDCDVLVPYQTKTTIINCSDLPALVKISYVSKCVRAAVHDIVIPPRDTYDLVFYFVPRQVNPGYRKVITFCNLRNPHAPDVTFTLRANCVDKQGISLHTLFYKILAPGPTNEVTFGNTVANRPTISAFRVRNETNSKLVLKLECTNGISTYAPPSALTRATWVAQRLLGYNIVRGLPSFGEKVRPRFDDSLPEKHALNVTAQYRTAVSLLDPGVGREYLPARCIPQHDKIDEFERACSWGYALENLDRQTETEDILNNEIEIDTNDDMSDPGTSLDSELFAGEDNWSKLVDILHNYNKGLLELVPTSFSNSEAELKFMERQLQPIRRLDAALRDGFLTETDTVSVPPKSEIMVVIKMTLTDEDVSGSCKLRSFERNLVVRMVEYDKSWLQHVASDGGIKLSVEELVEMAKCRTPREVTLAVRACKSAMSVEPLSQVNFGVVRVGDQKDKAITIVNLSEAPLLFEIGKRGLNDRNELRLNVGGETRGVVPPYFTRVVPFIFAPVTEGPFEREVIIHNRMDLSASGHLIVKAVVSK